MNKQSNAYNFSNIIMYIPKLFSSFGKGQAQGSVPTIIVTLLLFICFSTVATGKQLLLRDLLEIAEKQNISLKVEKLKIKKLWIEEKKASNLFIPDLKMSFSTSTSKYLDDAQRTTYGENSDAIVYSVKMNQTFYALGKGTILQRDISRYNTAIQKNLFRKKKIDLKKFVVEIFTKLVREKRRIAIYEETIMLAGKLLEIAKINQQVGLTLYNDILRIDVQKRNFEVSLLQSNNLFEKLLIDMANLLNIDDWRSLKIFLPDNVTYYKPFPVNEKLWEKRVRKVDIDMELKKIQFFMYRRIYKTAKKAYLPTLNFNGQYNYKDRYGPIDHGRDYSLGVSLDATLYDSGDLINEIRKAGKDLQIIKLERKDISNLKIASFRKTVLSYAEVIKRIKTDEKSVEQARENMRLVTTRYKAGDATIIELVDAQLTQTSSLLQILNGFYDERIHLADLFILTHDFEKLKKLDRRLVK
ncbi:TolC family protein [bacterium]|nr:TolC family protein [bacterium]